MNATTSQGAPSARVAMYLLQDSRSKTGDNLMFWARGGGYTSDLANAELFAEERAFAQNGSRPTDVPWPLDYLRSNSHRVVDMQYVKAAEAQAWHDQERFYRQDKGRGYVGNDLVFFAKIGKRSVVNLNEARIYTRAEVLTQTGDELGPEYWPVGYIDFLSRRAADSKVCVSSVALKDCERVLVKPERIKPDRYRCHSCQVFLKAVDYYGDCPRCGTSNRP